MTDIADLVISARADGVDRATRALDGLSESAQRTETTTERMSREVAEADQSVGRMGQTADGVARQIRNLAGVIGAGLSVREVVRYADAWTNLNNRLRLVTSGAAEFAAAQKGIFQVAQQTRQPIEATAELYQRVAMNQSQLGLTGQGVVDITRTISQAMVVSGTSAQGAQAALIQLGQAFASGTLRGEELNSVLEQAPGLAQAIAAGMGVTIGQLRALGAEGSLTAQAVVSALQSQADAVDQQFSQMAPTVDQAMTSIGNSMLELVGRMDEVTGMSGTLASLLSALAAQMRPSGAIGGALLTLSAEFADLGDIIGYNMARASLAIDAFIAKNTFQSKKYAELTRQMVLLDKSRLEQRAAMEERLAAILDESVAQQEAATEAARMAQPVYKDLAKIYEEMDKEMKSISDEHKKFIDRLRDIQEAVNPTTRAARLFNEEVEFMSVAMDKGYISREQFNDWLYKAKTELLPDVEVKLKGVKNEIEAITAKADPMSKVYERGLERMRDGFGDFFQQLIVDGRASFGGLLDLFKKMLAEMIATAAANRVMVSMGMMTAGQAAQAGGIMGQGGFSMGGLGGGLVSGITGGAQAIGSGLSNIGLTGAGDAFYNMGLAASNSSLLAGIGTALPWIGGGLLAANMLGLFDKRPSDKRQYASGGFGDASQILTGFSGGKFSAENQGQAGALLAQIQAMGQAIGGTTAAGSVSVGGRTGLRLSTGQGEGSFRTFKTEADLLAAAWKEVIAGATALEPSIKRLSEAFDGNIEASVAYTQSLQALWEASGRNGATAAATDYANAQRTLSDVYSASTANVRQLAATFDGSAESVYQLSQVLAENQGVAYQLAMQYRQVRDSVGELFGGLSESIRTSLMSQEELYNYQRTQVDALTASLSTLTDPAQIMQASQQIEQLMSGMWSRLSDEQRQEMGSGFLETIAQTEDVATRRLTEQLKMVEDSQQRTGELIQQSIRDAATELAQSAQTYQISAQTIQQAAAMMMQAAQAMQQGGREVTA